MSNEDQSASQAPTYKQMRKHRPQEGRFRSKIRVDHAMLFYKTDTILEWQMLERNEIGSRTDSNIVDLEFNGGIEFGQNGHAQSEDKDLQLRVRWEANDYQHVWLHQYQRRTLKDNPYQHLAVMFDAVKPPMATTIRAKMDPSDWTESSRANKRRKLDNEELAVPASGSEASGKLQFNDVSTIPLHRLAHYFADDKFNKILLVFPKRLSVQPKPPAVYVIPAALLSTCLASITQRLWSWETVVHLLLDRGNYWVRGDRAAQEERNAKSLEDQSRPINLEEGRVLWKATVGFWLSRTEPEVTDLTGPILPDLALAKKDFLDSQAAGDATSPALDPSESMSHVDVLAAKLESMKVMHAKTIENREELDRIIAEQAVQIEKIEEQLKETKGLPTPAESTDVAVTMHQVIIGDGEEDPGEEGVLDWGEEE